MEPDFGLINVLYYRINICINLVQSIIIVDQNDTILKRESRERNYFRVTSDIIRNILIKSFLDKIASIAR